MLLFFQFEQTGGVIQWAVGSQNGLLYIPKIVPSETRKAKKDMFLFILSKRNDFSTKHPIAWPKSVVPIQLVFSDSCTESKNALCDAYDELKIEFGEESAYGKEDPCKFAYDHFHAIQHINANSGNHWDRFVGQKDFSFLLGLVKSPFHGHSCFGLVWNNEIAELFKKSQTVELLEELLAGRRNLTVQKTARLVALRNLVKKAGELVQWLGFFAFVAIHFLRNCFNSSHTGIWALLYSREN